MRKSAAFILLFFPVLLFAQAVKKDSLLVNESRFSVSGGMGLSAISAKDVVDYLNYYVPPGFDEYKSISTAPQFYLNAEYRFSETYGIKLEYDYLVKTYNLENTNDILYHNISVTYSIHSPSIVINYIIRDPGYLVKFGAGLSYNYAELSRKTPVSGNDEIFSASGAGLKLDAYGHTQLGSNFYMVLGLNFSACILGDLKDSEGNYLSPKQKVNMSFVSAGLSFGLAYYF